MLENNTHSKLKATVAACWVIGVILTIAVFVIVKDQISYASEHLFDGVGAQPKSWDAWHEGGSSGALFLIGLLGVINTVVLVRASIAARNEKRRNKQ